MKTFTQLSTEEQKFYLQKISDDYENFNTIINSGKIIIDKDFVMEAVKQNGLALYYASETLCDDKDVVMAAVKQYEYALRYASERLQIALTANNENSLGIFS